jgi:hypothetical protein
MVMAIALVFTSCGGSDDGGTGSTDPEEEFAEDVVGDVFHAHSDLEQAITDRPAGLIQDGRLPYVVSQQPNFQDSTEELATETGLPTGTYLAIGFEVPEPDAEHPYSRELVIYGPLDLYAEAVRPYIDDMDFVVMYFLPWEGSGNYFLIYPEHMLLYLDGEISVKELSKKISIYGP